MTGTVSSLGVDPAKAGALLATMQAAGAAADSDAVTYLEQAEGGWSRHTYFATVAHTDGERRYVVRVRPQAPTLDTSLEQEFRVFSLLMDEPVATPDVHGCDASDDTPFGGPFFVMDHVDGDAPNVWRRRDRTALSDDWAGRRGVAGDLADNLAAIHAIDAGRAGQAAVARDFQQNIDHWRGLYESVRLVADPVVDEAYDWVRSREPDPVPATLVHGDYRIGNCLTGDGRVTGVLDWELCFVGDPRFDLGYLSMEYYSGKFTAPGSELLNAVAERDWFFERYTEKTGIEADPEVVRTFAAFGTLMVFAIMTTGLGVYGRGDSTDIRMAWCRYVLPGLRQDLTRLMDW